MIITVQPAERLVSFHSFSSPYCLITHRECEDKKSKGKVEAQLI